MSDWREGLDPQLLEIRIDWLELNVRSYNALKNAGFVTVADVVAVSDSRLRNLNHFGKNSFRHLLKVLEERCIYMNLPVPTGLQSAVVDVQSYDEYEDYVYLAEWSGFHKIGSSKDVEARIRALMTIPVVINLVHKVKTIVIHAGSAERELHKHFAQYRIEYASCREWFRLPDESVIWFCSLKDGELDLFKAAEGGVDVGAQEEEPTCEGLPG